MKKGGTALSKFNLLSYILPPEDKIFYQLFEDGTKVCKDASVLFDEIMTFGLQEDHIVRAKTLKHKSNDILKETLHQLNKTFVTPIEREDIQIIATQLNKITKRIVKACVNLRVYRLEKFTPNMKKQAANLMGATEELVAIMKKFKKVSSVEEMVEHNLRMKEIESHGDEILYMAMDELFSGDYDALHVLKMRDIHKDLENALDNCYLISDEVVTIVLKQS